MAKDNHDTQEAEAKDPHYCHDDEESQHLLVEDPVSLRTTFQQEPASPTRDPTAAVVESHTAARTEPPSISMSTLSDTSSSAPISQHDALMELLAPDGYYRYLGVEKLRVDTSTNNNSNQQGPTFTVDEDAVKKSYRKLSRRHHPDKGGDPNTFRLLNRAQRVLLHPKLRAQYDNLGIDLDDDDATTDHDDNTNTASSNAADDPPKDEGNGISQGIISELASLALTGIFQLTIRTALMGVAAVLIVRYRWTLFPALLFLLYVIVQIIGKASIRGGSVYDSGTTSWTDALSPALIMVGLVCMHLGRTSSSPVPNNDEDPTTPQSTTTTQEWTWLFWLGETMVLALFSYNSLPTISWNALSWTILAGVAAILALWFRGKFFNYLTVVVLELVLALLVAMAFPIIELLLETILNEKLRKVGEKIRSHHLQLEEYYAQKYNNNGGGRPKNS